MHLPGLRRQMEHDGHARGILGDVLRVRVRGIAHRYEQSGRIPPRHPDPSGGAALPVRVANSPQNMNEIAIQR